MLHRSKIALVAAVAATALMAVPAPAGAAPDGAALGPCRVVPTDTGTSIEPGWQYVAIAGVYTAPVGATGAELSCKAVVNGQIYASVPDKVPGPFALLAGTGKVPANGLVTSCYTLRVTYLVGSSTTTDTCP